MLTDSGVGPPAAALLVRRSHRPYRSALALAPAAAGDLARAFELMRANMQPDMALAGIAWERDWMEENYRSKDNYNILMDGDWKGFLSIEYLDGALFIHTLQLTPQSQGRLYGMAVFDWLVHQAKARGAGAIRCRAFRHSAAVPLYQKLGFRIVAESGVLLELALALKPRSPATRPVRKPPVAPAKL